MINKTIQEFHKKHYQPVKSWRVESSHKHSDTGGKLFYITELWGNGTWTCTCIAGEMRRKCKHVIKCQDEMAEEKYYN